LLEKLPGVASADADKTTSSATIIYDKSVFDSGSIGDEGRYKFDLRQDSAAADKDAEGALDDDEAVDDENVEEKNNGEDEKPSMIKIEDAPAGDDASGSGKKEENNIVPSLDGPAS